MVGGIIPLRRATSSRYDGRLGQESAYLKQLTGKIAAALPLATDLMDGRRVPHRQGEAVRMG
jgi:hypothetical protein